ncbi:hypothetical protein HYDPIDRAFT_25213 [Hydnomerulius pinastri MD-312]|nr:hypothetical protein HYDPIDRAFT_25213 [Hydnomerulius pinastri MD-312]
MSSDDLDAPAKRRLLGRVNLKGLKAIKGISKPFKSARERKKIPLPVQSSLPTPPATPSGPPMTSTKHLEARPMTPVPSTTSPEGTSTQTSGAGPSRHGLSLSPGSWTRSRPRPPPIPVHEIAAARPHDYVAVGEGRPSPARRKFPRRLKPSPDNKPWHKYALKIKEKWDKKAAEESDSDEDSSDRAASVAPRGKRKASPSPAQPPCGSDSGTAPTDSQQGARSAGHSAPPRASSQPESSDSDSSESTWQAGTIFKLLIKDIASQKMGGKPPRASVAPKLRSSKQDGKKNAVKQAAKKKHKQWSKDRSERAREVLDRDADVLYNVLGSHNVAPITAPQADSVLTLTESIQSLGK